MSDTETPVLAIRPAKILLTTGKEIQHDQLRIYASGLVLDAAKRQVYSPSAYVWVAKG